MNYIAMVIIALHLILFIVAIFVCESKITEDNIQTPYEFTSQVTFDDYISPTVNIENEKDCNANNLSECLLDDPTTLFGCRELAVQCKHFPTDIDYHVDGVVRKIPANRDPNVGYALSLVAINEDCNPFHGDLVLVSANEQSSEYMLICECKRPGFIGKDTLLGNCTSVKICNGKIDNINQPFDKINCKCNLLEKNIRYDDGLSVCKKMTVAEANEIHDDWTDLIPWINKRQLPIEHFNPTIKDNLRIKKLMNPCNNAITDYSQEIPGGEYNHIYNACTVTDSGVLVQASLLNSDDSKKSKYDSVFPSGPIEYFRFMDNVDSKRKVVTIKTKINNEDVWVVIGEDVSVGKDGNIHLPIKNNIIAGECEGSWPRYHCYMRDYTENTLVYDLPHARYRSAPGSFLWDVDEWENSEQLLSRGVQNKSTGLEIDNTAFNKIKKLKPFGLIFHREGFDSEKLNGMLSFTNDDDYYKQHNTIVT